MDRRAFIAGTLSLLAAPLAAEAQPAAEGAFKKILIPVALFMALVGTMVLWLLWLGRP